MRLIVLIVARERFEFGERADRFQVVSVHQKIVLPKGSPRATNLSRTPLPITATSRRLQVIGFGREAAFAERGIDQPQVFPRSRRRRGRPACSGPCTGQ